MVIGIAVLTISVLTISVLTISVLALVVIGVVVLPGLDLAGVGTGVYTEKEREGLPGFGLAGLQEEIIGRPSARGRIQPR